MVITIKLAEGLEIFTLSDTSTNATHVFFGKFFSQHPGARLTSDMET